jgi:hypothetical protein
MSVTPDDLPLSPKKKKRMAELPLSPKKKYGKPNGLPIHVVSYEPTIPTFKFKSTESFDRLTFLILFGEGEIWKTGTIVCSKPEYSAILKRLRVGKEYTIQGEVQFDVCVQLHLDTSFSLQ